MTSNHHTGIEMTAAGTNENIHAAQPSASVCVAKASKKSDRAFLVIPAGINLPKSKADADAIALFLSDLQFQTELTPQRKYLAHWISFESSKLREQLGGRYTRRLSILVESQAIEINHPYSTGNEKTEPFPKSYRLTREHRTGKSRVYEMQTARGRLKARQIFDSRIDDKMDVNGDYFARKLSEFVIDADAARQNPKLSNHWAQTNIMRWETGQHFATRCEMGRFHSLATQQQRESRSHLSTATGEPIVIVDISACQPLIMGLLAAHNITHRPPQWSPNSEPLLPYVAHFLPRDTPKDVLRWIEMCETREIYGHFYDEIRSHPEPIWRTIECRKGRRIGQQITRDMRTLTAKEFKRTTLIPLFDEEAKMEASPVFGVLKRDFPSIANWVKETKKPDLHQTTARLCQRVESELMIDGVGEVLRTRYIDEPVNPIHDALICREGFAGTAQSLIREQFERYGLHPQIKIEAA
ncbi:hypothetical protein U8335_26610 [Roseiconus lacunae]|uniref:hypothetical protein n=1 Tax=Roseiconus lacunae TaxID=2605694 RepID=UPI00308AD715|nr:hypothetical protein U8335_26610 [Stieleria sp. HD01]